MIVNADDFGYSLGVNRGIAEAHERGIVTSASLMVAAPGTREAAEYARDHPSLGVGLHAVMRHWRVRRAPWSKVRSEARLAAEVRRELETQLELFEQLLDRPPTHLDSHQHRHRLEPLRGIFIKAAGRLGVPLRHFDSRIRFWGDFYGHDGRGKPDPDAISVDALITLLEQVPPGATELGCHAGYGDDLDDWYRSERAIEVRALCDPQVTATVERIGLELVSFDRLNLPHER